MKLGLALLRMIVGTLFMGHGLQKLAGWFGGHGLAGTGAFFEALGLRPGKVQAAASGAAETLGGALLVGGLLTPLGASMISGSMLTAIRKVHAKNGLWVNNNGFEYNLVLLGIVFAVTDLGPGSWSLDEALGVRRRGPAWAIAQLAAGAAGSAAAVALGERQGAAPADSAATAPASNGAGAEEADARRAMAAADQ
jgi:putative oxidoreductase